MILKKDFIVDAGRYPSLIIDSTTKDDDEITLNFVTPYSDLTIYINPETIDAYIKVLTDVRDSISAGEYEGPAI